MECRCSMRLCCVWSVCLLAAVAVPDAPSLRDSKLQQLIRSLGTYDAEQHSLMVKNHSKPLDVAPTPTVLPKTLPRSRSQNEDSSKFSLPDAESIQSYQDFYKAFYGTPEGVSFLRKQYGPNRLQEARAKFTNVNKEMEEVRLAMAHFSRIRKQAACGVPLAQLVRVQDIHPDPSLDYKPRCTRLHRCGEQAGCCESDAFHCAPRAVQEVALHFYALPVGRVGGRKATVQRLLFENHTACECQPVNDMPRMQEEPALPDRVEPTSRCGECPVPFSKRVYADGRCGCDCFDRQRPCLRVKRGKDPLQSIERRCVESHHCHIPECEHGEYDPVTGFCPRRHDERPHRRPHDGHRWTFHERD